MKIRKLTIALLSLLLLLLPVKVSQAHSGEPRLEINLEKLAPGAALDVRGVNFEPEEEIQLTLVGLQVEHPLGVVTADSEGTFIQVVVLPENLAVGIYSLRAKTDDHIIFSPQFTVSGTLPSSPEENQDGQRDEEDGLLAPMPTFQPGATAVIISTPIPAISTPTVISTLDTLTAAPSNAVFPLTQVVVVGVVFLVLTSVVVLGRKAMGNR